MSTLIAGDLCPTGPMIQAGESEASILLLASEGPAVLVSHALRSGFPCRVEIVSDQHRCMEALRREEFSLLLVEESVAAASEAAGDALYEAAGTAVIVVANFGIASPPRLVRQVRSALRRRRLNERRARAAAWLDIRNELTAPLTGLLLESQLALRQAPPEVAPGLERLVALAEHVCDQLRSSV